MRILLFLLSPSLSLCFALSLIGPAQAWVVQAVSDATITAALRTGVYDDNFAAGFKAGVASNAAGLVMAYPHNVIGSGVIDGCYSEGGLSDTGTKKILLRF